MGGFPLFQINICQTTFQLFRNSYVQSMGDFSYKDLTSFRDILPQPGSLLYLLCGHLQFYYCVVKLTLYITILSFLFQSFMFISGFSFSGTSIEHFFLEPVIFLFITIYFLLASPVGSQQKEAFQLLAEYVLPLHFLVTFVQRIDAELRKISVSLLILLMRILNT